jgi:hypothetical protein
MSKRSFAAVAAILLLSGCTIHPVPEDVTGVTTYAIARQIRCETREAAKDIILLELKALAAGGPNQLGDLKAQELLARYGGGGEDISTFRPALFSGPQYQEVRNYLNIVYSTAVAYSFDLTMDESDTFSPKADLVGPWLNKFTLGLTGDANRDRSNERTFTLTDTFGDLLMNVSNPQRQYPNPPYCSGQIVGPNYIYPIAGQIGVYKMVHTFFELNEFTNLAPTDSSSKSSNAAITAPTLTDKLIFTTTIDASVNPVVTFAPIGKAFQFADASFTAMAKRVDTHKVFVSLAVESSANAAAVSLRNFLFQGPGSAPLAVSGPKQSSTYIGASVTARPRTPAQGVAVQTLDNERSRETQVILGH